MKFKFIVFAILLILINAFFVESVQRTRAFGAKGKKGVKLRNKGGGVSRDYLQKAKKFKAQKHSKNFQKTMDTNNIKK